MRGWPVFDCSMSAVPPSSRNQAALPLRARAGFAAAERLDLEGIVAKRKADAYRPETIWYKVKSRTYTQGEGRWELFQKGRIS